MRLVRSLQHWLRGTGLRLQVTDFVPHTHPLRQWADTFPWAALVAAVEHSFAQRFPKRSPRGRAPVPLRVLLALELLKHALGASDEDMCHRLRTDFAVMYACGLQEYHVVIDMRVCVGSRESGGTRMVLHQEGYHVSPYSRIVARSRAPQKSF
jgi:hypothetical protein